MGRIPYVAGRGNQNQNPAANGGSQRTQGDFLVPGLESGIGIRVEVEARVGSFFSRAEGTEVHFVLGRPSCVVCTAHRGQSLSSVPSHLTLLDVKISCVILSECSQ